MFRIKYGHKLELQTPETMKLYGSTKRINRQNKDGEDLPSLEVVLVVLVQCNLVDNHDQQESEVLYTLNV